MTKERRRSQVVLLLLALLCAVAAASPLVLLSNASQDSALASVTEFWREVQTEVMSISAEMQTACPEQSFTCLRNGSFPLQDAEEEGVDSLCSLCRCDPDCLVYGDCCPDYTAAADIGRYDNRYTAGLGSGHPHQHGTDLLSDAGAGNVNVAFIEEEEFYGKLTTRVAFIEADQERLAFVCSSLNFQMAGMYMVGSCPKKFADTTVEKLCQRQVPEPEYTYLVDLPVTSAATNLTYVNYYCALCHADADQLHSWNISIQCRGLPKGITMHEFMRTAEYSPGLRMWRHSTDHNTGGLKTTVCLLRVLEFSNAAQFISQFGGRECVEPQPICAIGDTSHKCSSQVRTCAEAWTDKRVQEKCERYSMLTLHRHVVYRNPHCALCNGVNTSELACMSTKGCVRWHRNVFLPQAFSTLMDFRSANCSDHDLYDPLSGKCQAVKCGNLFTLESGACVRDESASLTAGVSYLNDSCAKISFPKQEFIINENDSSITVTSTKKHYKWGQYELDEHSNLLVCNQKYVYLSTITHPQKIVTFVVLMISVLCLTAHIVIFWLFPKMQNLPGKNLCSLSFSLLLAHFLLLTGMQAQWHSGICIIVGISLHYFWLASFCWMNVMSLDVFITFKGAVHRGSDGNTKTFLGYAAYSWGVPLLVILSALTVQFTDIMPLYKPQYNSGSLCWINNRDALILFFLIPIGVIILENVALFMVTSYGIYQQSKYSKFAQKRSQSIKKHEEHKVPKETKVDSHKNKAERKDRIRFLLYIKLGIIQGLTWTTGFLAAITGLPACWYLFTVLNGLQGFFIFLSFDLKRKVWQSVQEKLTGKLWSLRSSMGTSTTTFTTVTSSARRFQRSLQSSKARKNSGPVLQVDDGKGKSSEKTINFHPQESRAVISDRKTNVEILDKNSSFNGQNEDQGEKSLDKSVKKSFEIEKLKDLERQANHDNKNFVKQHNRSAPDIRPASFSDRKTIMKSPTNDATALRRSYSSRDPRGVAHAVVSHSQSMAASDSRTRENEPASSPELNNKTSGKVVNNDVHQRLKAEPKPILRVKNPCGVHDQ